MDLDQAIRERRSVRRFLPEPVPREDIEAMLEAACWAPSSTNSQPWRFLVVLRREWIEETAALVFDFFDRAMKEAHSRGERTAAALLRFLRGYGSFLRVAPVLIVACGVPYTVPKYGLEGAATVEKLIRAGGEQIGHIFFSTVDKSVAMATQNLMLKAHAMGYGTVAIDTPLAVADEIKALLKMPAGDSMRVVMVIALGRPAEHPSAPLRRPVSTVSYFLE